MTLNSFYNGLIGNVFYGGIAAILLIGLMFWKANKIAASGSKGKMMSWAVAPAIMVVVAIMAHGMAVNIIWPKIQGAFTSTPVQNLVATGGALTQTADNILWGGGGELQAMPMGPDAFKAPVQEAVNDGRTATFEGQPTTLENNFQMQVFTPNQAVEAVNALAATATPVGGGQAYINTFLADQTGGSTYVIQRGDSMSKIANKYGVSLKALCEANRATVPNCNVISAGTSLLIPAGGSSPANDGSVTVQTVPASFGQQASTYTTQPTPAPVVAYSQPVPVQRNVANGQVVVTSNASAVQAIQALGPLPTVAPVVAAVVQPTATPRAAYVLTEVLAKPAPGGGQAYIDQFLKTQTDTTIAGQ